MQYRREIDGLRAIAVLSVLFFHANWVMFRGGFVGVDVFFVISGYLITSLILREQHNGVFSLKNFYERRARRILPALFFVILCCIPAAFALMMPGQLYSFGRSIIAVILFLSNLFFFMEISYFSRGAGEQPLLHTWSLAVEEQYYVVFPLFIMAFWFIGNKKLKLLVVFLAFVSLLITAFGNGLLNSPSWSFYLPLTRAWELLAGAVCAFWLLENKDHRGNEYLSFLGLFLILYAVFFVVNKIPIPTLSLVMPVAGTVIIILFAKPSTLVGRLLSHPVLVGIGLVSYSAYLWHQPLFAFARIHNDDMPWPGQFFVLIILSLVLAWFSWRYVEQPFRNRKVVPLKTFLRLSLSVITILVAVSFSIIYSRGFINLYPDEDRELYKKADYITQGKYVSARFASHILKDYKDNAGTRVLVLGDSFGQDFVNALYEGGIGQKLQISTYPLGFYCENLLLFKTGEKAYDSGSPFDAKCNRNGWFRNKKLQSLFEKADVVIFSFSWSLWAAKHLPENIKKIKQESKAKILVIGSKDFGKINIKRLLSTGTQKRLETRNIFSKKDLEVNSFMKKTLDPDVFVNTRKLMCGTESSCKIFSSKGKLITYDGTHLTKAGAIVLGHKLAADERVKQTFQASGL